MRRYSLTVDSAPAAEPLTRAEAKTHLRIDADITDQDSLIDALIAAAREWVETWCRRSLVRRTYSLRMDDWCVPLLLPRGPVASVSSISYVDSGGASQTLAADQYQTDLYAVPARILPAYGVVWPVLQTGTINAVTVTYVAGYAPDETGSPTDHAGNVPKAVKAAMLLLIGHLYENREQSVIVTLAELPMGVKSLLAPYEIRDYRLE